MGFIDEMKQDVTDNVVDTILSDPKTKQMLEIANPFIKPALKSLLKELGPDDNRLMLYFDNESQKLVFLKMKTANIKQFEVEGIDMDKDVFTVNPEDIKKGEVTDVIKAIIKRIGVKLM